MVGPAILAFATAAAVSASELITTRYPRTYFLLKRSRALYAYVLIYGFIAFGVLFLSDALVRAGTVKLEGLGLSSPWVRAIAVGITVKAFLHINLFTVGAGSQSKPVGLETVVQLFEPQLLRTITLDEDDAVKRYIQPRAARYPPDNPNNLNNVKALIKDNVPAALPDEERAAFENDVDKAPTVTRAMEKFLRFVGRATFERVFPL